uniref:Solute carrier family 66 member 3 n=1 Tax=Pavo cristatus TaxID=9049 RepID=A0A8C9G9I1_PAVCR
MRDYSILLDILSWSSRKICRCLVHLRAGAVVSLCAVMLFYVFLSSFVVFLRYQIYYDYPLQTYLEYPIIIAQDVILLLLILHFSGNMKQALLYAVTQPCI